MFYTYQGKTKTPHYDVCYSGVSIELTNVVLVTRPPRRTHSPHSGHTAPVPAVDAGIGLFVRYCGRMICSYSQQFIESYMFHVL